MNIHTKIQLEMEMGMETMNALVNDDTKLKRK